MSQGATKISLSPLTWSNLLVYSLGPFCAVAVCASVSLLVFSMQLQPVLQSSSEDGGQGDRNFGGQCGTCSLQGSIGRVGVIEQPT